MVTATLGGPEAPFLKLNPHEYRLNPGSRQDYEQLLEQLTVDGLVPASVVHAGGILTDRERVQPRLAALSLARERAFLSLMFLLRSLGAATTGVPVRLIALTNNACRVDLDKEVYPDAAMVTGPARVASREYPQLSCTTLDISLAPAPRRRIARTAGAISAEVAEQVVAELALGGEDRVVALRGQRRWVQTVRECAMNTVAGVDGDGPRPGGCYLITGGFGGVASAFADDLARLGARLVLVGRTPIGAKAERIAELEALGAEVLAISADVADLKSMARALAQARSRFGPINGVIHAAGTLQDELLDIKDRESAEAVIRPKVVGAVVLEQVLDFASLDFAVLCSSTSAFLGPAGQADYAAANSFLDAFAQHRTAAGDRRTVSVNWGMWDGIGMTAMPSAAPVGTSITIRETGHPLLGSVVRETATETWFESLVSASTHWVVDEHRLADGTAVMPGAGYVEMVRAAAQELSPGPVEIRNLEFHRPLIANEAQKLQVRAIRSQDRLVISICSGPVGTADSQLIERATAMVVRCADALPELPVCACRSADGDTVLPDQPRRAIDQHGHLRFGPRWHNVVSNNVIGGEVIAHVSLAEEFRQELELFELHPAMIDMATGLGLPLVPGYSSSNDLYIPLAYGRIRAHAPLPATFVSRIRLASCQDVHDTVSFNVDLTSEVGDPLVSIEDLVLRRVQDPASISEPANRTVGARGSESAPRRLKALGRAHGISAADGWQALRSALSLSSVPQIVITPVPLRTLDEACARDAASASPTTAVSRPQAMTDFEPPRDALERELAGWWSELLGIRDIGVNDDFFELGGHSLIAVRLSSRVRKAFGIQIPLATLFVHPTIAALSEFIRDEAPAEARFGAQPPINASTGWSSLVPIQPLGSKRPFFCVHGMYGNVLNLRPLAVRLGNDQPFYGLQQKGLNGIDTPHSSFEEMAAAYLLDIRAIQPVGPYAIGGYSGGGLIAFEMAHQLRAAGDEVSLLAMFDTPGPGVIDRSWRRRSGRFVRRLRAGGLRFAARRVGQARRSLLVSLNPNRPAVIVVEEEFLTIELGSHMLRAQDAYSFRPLAGCIALFRATERDTVDAFLPYDLGWTAYASNGVEVTEVPGGHLTMCLEPNVPVLAAAISRKLAANDEATQPPCSKGGKDLATPTMLDRSLV